jgi:hypothetical protein
MVVTSSFHSSLLSVYKVPVEAGDCELKLVSQFRGAWWRRGESFRHASLVFVGGDEGPGVPLLLASITEKQVVIIMDLAKRRRVGLLAPPGAMKHPRAVQARGSLAAVACWDVRGHGGEHVVRLFESAGPDWMAWTPLRTLGGGWGEAYGQFKRPSAMWFTRDGAGVLVADMDNFRVSLFGLADGAFVKHVVTGVGKPFDVVAGEGGLLVCTDSRTIEFVGDGDGNGTGGPHRTSFRGGDLEWPVRLVLVPSLGLVVSDVSEGKLVVFQSHANVAMAAMSAARVGWMSVCCRATRLRHEGGPGSGPCGCCRPLLTQGYMM